MSIMMKYWTFITIVPRMQRLNHSMLKSNFSELIFMEWQIKSFSSLESQSPKDIPIKFLLPPKLSINFASSLLKQTCLRHTQWNTIKFFQSKSSWNNGQKSFSLGLHRHTDIQQDFYDQLKLTIKHNFINFQRDCYKKNKRKKTIIMFLPFKCI